MRNVTKRQNGSITIYSSSGVPNHVLDCPSSDGMRHRVYIQGPLVGPSILRCHAKAEIVKGGELVKGEISSSVQGWRFNIK